MNPDSIGLVRLVQLCSVLACFASLSCVNIRTTIDRVALKLFDRQTFLQFSALYCLACKRRDLTRYLVSERVQLKTLGVSLSPLKLMCHLDLQSAYMHARTATLSHSLDTCQEHGIAAPALRDSHSPLNPPCKHVAHDIQLLLRPSSTSIKHAKLKNATEAQQ